MKNTFILLALLTFLSIETPVRSETLDTDARPSSSIQTTRGAEGSADSIRTSTTAEAPTLEPSSNPQRSLQKPRWLLDTLSGEQIDLAKRIQQPQNRIMIFWATWCPYCKQLLPIIDNLKRDYPDLEVLAFNVFDDLAVKDYADKAPWPFVHVLGGDEFARAHGVKGLPTLFLVNDKGRMVLDLREINTKVGTVGKSNKAKAAHHAPLWDKGLRESLDKLVWR